MYEYEVPLSFTYDLGEFKINMIGEIQTLQGSLYSNPHSLCQPCNSLKCPTQTRDETLFLLESLKNQ